MAIPHAKSGEVISVQPFGPDLSDARTTVLIKTEGLEVIRLVVPRGKQIPPHSTRGEITVHCLEGRIAFTAGDVTHELGAGQLLHVGAGERHSLLGIDDASLLVTLALPPRTAQAEPIAPPELLT